MSETVLVNRLRTVPIRSYLAPDKFFSQVEHKNLKSYG